MDLRLFHPFFILEYPDTTENLPPLPRVEDSTKAFRVVVRIRPLIKTEIESGDTPAVSAAGDEATVQVHFRILWKLFLWRDVL